MVARTCRKWQAGYLSVSGLRGAMDNIGRYLLIVVACALLLGSLHLHFLAEEVKSWPTTLGRLDSKGIVKYGAGPNGAGAGSDSEYTVYVRYTYQLGDNTFQGTNVRIWDMTFNYRSAAERYLKEHNAGENVQVFYNPAKPDQSYLDPGYPLTPVFFMLLGALMSGAASIFYRWLAQFFYDWSTAR
jgi:hypothetical protein